MNAAWDKDCISCQAIRASKRINKVPRVMETKNWVVEHGYPTSIRGWMVIMPKRHVVAVHELTRDEMEEFGDLLQAVCLGQHELYETEKEYFVQYSEGEGYSHLNIHIVPRLEKWPDAMKGFGVFSGIGENIQNPITEMAAAEESMKLQTYLLKHLPARILNYRPEIVRK